MFFHISYLRRVSRCTHTSKYLSILRTKYVLSLFFFCFVCSSNGFTISLGASKSAGRSDARLVPVQRQGGPIRATAHLGGRSSRPSVRPSLLLYCCCCCCDRFLPLLVCFIVSCCPPGGDSKALLCFASPGGVVWLLGFAEGVLVLRG